MANTKKIKRGDLLPWFLEDHSKLPAWYLKDCEEFVHLPEPTEHSDPSWFGFPITLKDNIAIFICSKNF